MLSGKKVLAVVGATGRQGGSLVEAILEEGEKTGFCVRAITRNPSSEKAENLRKRGVEVVQADINDEDSVTKAFEDAYGAFCVTFFWEHMNPDQELRQAQNLAIAAKRAGLKHVIWSTFEDSRRRLPVLTSLAMPSLGEGDRFKVPQCDAKGEADHFFEDAGVPTTYMLTSFFWDNFLDGMGPTKGADGKLEITLPLGADKRLAGIASEDIGRCALDIFQRPDEYINKRVAIVGDLLTMREITAKIAYMLGREIRYNEITFDDYRKLGFHGAVELGNMFQFFNDCEEDLADIRSVHLSRKLNLKMLTFSQWVEKNKMHFKIDSE